MRLINVLSFCLPLLLAACGDLPSKLSDTERSRIATVQTSYDREFQAALSRNGAVSSSSSFPDTLALISDARTPPPSAEAGAYLNVLEGMIYLQTDQTGKAAAMRGDVANAAGVLKGRKALYPRDALFAKSFASLLQGREAMSALSATSGNTAADQARRVTLADQLTGAAAQLTGTLCADRRAGQLAAPADDDGAALVAGFGATFLANADFAAQKVCVASPQDIPLCARFTGQRADLVAARNLRATFRGTVSPGSQLRSLDADINRLLTLEFGAAVPAPADSCG